MKPTGDLRSEDKQVKYMKKGKGCLSSVFPSAEKILIKFGIRSLY
jgi:hypothetical protein